MNHFVRPSFFRLFDMLLSTTNAGFKHSQWTWNGVDFSRERHSFTGPRHSLSVEIFMLTREGRHGWTLMVTKECWWAGDDNNKVLRSPRWARSLAGRRSDIIAWLKEQETAIERQSSITRTTARPEERQSFRRAIRDTDAAAELVGVENRDESSSQTE
jgi:hypothetical protein